MQAASTNGAAKARSGRRPPNASPARAGEPETTLDPDCWRPCACRASTHRATLYPGPIRQCGKGRSQLQAGRADRIAGDFSSASGRSGVDGRGLCWGHACGRQQNGDRPPAPPSTDAVLRHRLRRRRDRPGPRRRHLPAAELLPESERLDAGRGHRLFRRAELPLGHQAGVRPGVGFRAAVRLSPQELPGAVQPRRHRRLCLDRPAERAGAARAAARAHLLCHGDVEHAVRRPAGREQRAASARAARWSPSSGCGSTSPSWRARWRAAC